MAGSAKGWNSKESDPGKVFDLDDWYNSGKPIFTKEAMRQVVSQLPLCRASVRHISNHEWSAGLSDEEMQLLTLQGRLVSCPIMEVCVEQSDLPDEEYIWTPECSYIPYEVGKDRYESDRVMSDELCGVSVGLFRSFLRSKTTKARIVRPPDVSEEGSAQRFQQALKQWQSSEAWNAIEKLLRANFSHRVGNLILFAGGRLSMMEGEYDGHDTVKDSEKRTVQHCLPLLINRVLCDLKVADETTECFAQDPIYTDVDITVLRQNGVTVLGDPYGFLEADSTSCVLFFSPDVPVDQIILDITRPALLITDTLEMKPEANILPGDELMNSRLFKILQEEYHSFPILQHEAFSPIPVTMFIRKS